ncbi:MAG: hypothetical protein Q4D21_03180 [Phascolarctobacterium sp.]|nr:hypothetical protein [Phascolarctobacterium sp.]
MKKLMALSIAALMMFGFSTNALAYEKPACVKNIINETQLQNTDYLCSVIIREAAYLALHPTVAQVIYYAGQKILFDHLVFRNNEYKIIFCNQDNGR